MTRQGFTLIEMVIVVALIGVVMAIVLPYLMPAILFSRLEGAARHLAGFGKGAMAYSTLMRKPITVKIDLDKQTYWAEELVEKEDESLFDEDPEALAGKAAEDGGDMSSFGSAEQFMDLMGRSDPENVDPDQMTAGAEMLRERFERFARTQMEARAKRVENKGILDEIGPLFEEEFTLDDEEEEYEPVKDPLLEKTMLPQGVEIEGVDVGSESNSSGLVEFELSPVGFSEFITFYVKGEDGEYFTVTWDPVTGGTRLEEGKQEPEEAPIL